MWVDVQCSDIHMLRTVRLLLSTTEVRRCLQGRLAVDGAAVSVQSLLQDDDVVREQLLSKRVQCVCRCDEVRETERASTGAAVGGYGAEQKLEGAHVKQEGHGRKAVKPIERALHALLLVAACNVISVGHIQPLNVR